MEYKNRYFQQNRTASQPDGTFRPQLTSLIDVMTILLVFLIKSFSVEGNLITPSPDLLLPDSNSKKPPKLLYSIEITKTAVLSEGEKVVEISEFENQDTLLVPQLYHWMLIQREKLSSTATAKEVLIQSDREIAFKIIKKVMFTCSKAGFSEFSVLVLGAEQ